MGRITDEQKIRYCVKYLREHGIDSGDKFTSITVSPDDPVFEFVQTSTEDYFTKIAKGLRNLWPKGEKDGKYPWRDSESNTVTRLRSLWVQRKLSEIPVDDVLTVARKYIAQFEHDTKYMKTLKYFIYKQKKSIIDPDGKVHFIIESQLADMLDSRTVQENQEDYGMENISQSFFEGELI